MFLTLLAAVAAPSLDDPADEARLGACAAGDGAACAVLAEAWEKAERPDRALQLWLAGCAGDHEASCDRLPERSDELGDAGESRLTQSLQAACLAFPGASCRHLADRTGQTIRWLGSACTRGDPTSCERLAAAGLRGSVGVRGVWLEPLAAGVRFDGGTVVAGLGDAPREGWELEVTDLEESPPMSLILTHGDRRVVLDADPLSAIERPLDFAVNNGRVVVTTSHRQGVFSLSDGVPLAPILEMPVACRSVAASADGEWSACLEHGMVVLLRLVPGKPAVWSFRAEETDFGAAANEPAAGVVTEVPDGVAVRVRRVRDGEVTEVVAKADGSFRFDAPREPLDRYQAVADGWISRAAVGRGGALELALAPARSIEVEVRGSDNRPAAGARLLARGARGHWIDGVELDESGKATLSVLAEEEVTLYATGQRGRLSQQLLEPEAQPKRMRLRIPSSSQAVRHLFLDEKGDPVPGIRGVSSDRWFVSDAEGWLVVPFAEREPKYFDQPGRTHRLQVDPGQREVLVGTATLRVARPDVQFEPRFFSGLSGTGAHGGASLDGSDVVYGGLSAGDWLLLSRGADGPRSAVQEVSVDIGETVEVEPEWEAATVYGRVVYPDGWPVSGASVTTVCTGDGPAIRESVACGAVTTADGWFEITGLSGSSWTLNAGLVGQAPWAEKTIDSLDGRVEIVLEGAP